MCLCGEGNGTPLQYSCLENPMDGGAWWATVHRVAKSQTWLSDDFTFTFHFYALEKEMAPDSSVLAWRIPAELCGLPSMRSHRVGHDWSDLAAAAACVCVCVLVSACSHLCNSLTITTSSLSAPSLCSAEFYFLGTNMKTKCSLILKSLKVLWDTDPKLQSTPQVLSFLLFMIKFT